MQKNGSLDTMRPKFRTGVFFAPAEDGDGALLTHGSNVTLLRGPTTYAWLQRLVPYLNGSTTLAALTASLSPPKKDMVQRLVAALRDAELVRDAGADDPHSLTAAELETYAPEVAFIEAFRDSGPHRFQRFRDARMVAVGSGLLLMAVAHAGLAAGVRQLTLLVTSECPTDLSRLEEESLPLRDPSQRTEVRLLTTPGDDTDLERLITSANVVVHASDRTSPARALMIDRICADAGIVSVQTLITGDQAWIGPVCGPDRPAVSWASLWHRLAGPGGAATPPSDFLTGPVPGIIANHAVFACFEHLCGVGDPDDAGRAVRLDLETLQTDEHPVIAHPFARPLPEQSEDRTTSPAGAPAEADEEDFARRLSLISGTTAAVFGPADERHFRQFPLRVVEVGFSQPLGPRGSVRARTAHGAGLDLATARRRAAQRAAELYASEMIDPRRLVTADGIAPVGPDWPDSSGVASLTWPDMTEAFAWGSSLRTGLARQVPVGRVFPGLNATPPSGPADRASPGTACRDTWDAAVEAGLLGHCLDAAVSRAVALDEPVPEIEPAAVALSETADRYRELLAAAGQQFVIADVSYLSGVHVYAFNRDGRTIAFRAGLTPAEAIEAGLEELLLDMQSEQAGQPEYAPRPVPQVRTRAGAVAPDTVADGPTDQAERLRILLDALAAYDPVVVPLDHDPALGQVLPHVLRVMLLDA